MAKAAPPKGKALIAGHRGMGVLDKPRNEYLTEEVYPLGPDAQAFAPAYFYPENSYAAFSEAIRQGADALECDVHVSKDGIPMVIHGPALLKYASYSGGYAGNDAGIATTLRKDLDALQATAEGGPGSGAAKRELAQLKVENFTCAELKNNFRLKGSDPNIPAEARMPSLADYLNLAYETNKDRATKGLPPLKLNIELKGEGSAVASIGCITHFYKNNPDAAKFIAPENMVFLGRHDRQEVAIANSLLKNDPDLFTKMCADLEIEPKAARSAVLKQADFHAAKCGMTRKEFLTAIPKELAAARTNVILSTNDLFGKKSALNEDCDTSPATKEVSAEGAKKVFNALAVQRYDGVDISLYDFTPEVIKAVKAGIAAHGPHPVPIIGVSASGWKGSEREDAVTGPAFAVSRAEAIASQLGTDVLLKVDEPGVFKGLLERTREAASPAPKPRTLSDLVRSMGQEGAEAAFAERLLNPNASVNGLRQQGVDVDVEHLTDVEAARGAHLNAEIPKVSSKPPRGPEKTFAETPEEQALKLVLQREAEILGDNLKKAGVDANSFGTPANTTPPLPPTARALPKGPIGGMDVS